MITLIQNEWIKLWSKKRTWIFALFILLITIGIAFFFKSVIFDMDAANDENWEQDLEEEIAVQEEIMADEDADEWQVENAQMTIQQNEEMLASGINPNKTNNMIFLEETFPFLASFITLFSVIVASSIVSSEIDDGTMKHLLIRPYPRWKFITAKLITTVGFSLSLIVVLLVSNLLIGTILLGTGSLSTEIMVNNFETTPYLSTVGEVLPARVGLYVLNVLMFIIISFSVSILFRSQTLAVGIGIFILFGTNIAQSFNVLLADTSWYQYIFLPHLSLPEYAIRDEILPGVGLAFSIMVLSVYALVFLGACFTYFQRKDFAE
ncbi:ABC-2 type transport system permease protein [Pelagirhabdus alkalitolerans]|uniref:ABC-2 type transport system permease protein n=1 Tax=Pelagirhabdus alkalitolerans TaxID=1612202 RepID=A0A1G6JWM8_9BACI|nr:ABC transporter permease [Pelagirhabdus alkalitolerans]SDC23162.1 ABC-2 type transport system permease protein [Pelagirhabdus alkalitolerans]